MAECTNYNCDDDLGLHLLNDCGTEKLGGVKDLIILECNHTVTDPSNASQITANIAAGTATLVKNVKIGVPAPSPIKTTALIACATDKIRNYDRTFTMMDGNVNANNIDMYNNLLGGQVKGGVILHECGADEVTWIDDAVSFEGGRVIPDTDNESQHFAVTASWRKLTEAQIYDTPAGIFD